MADNEHFQGSTHDLPEETEQIAVPSGEAKRTPPPERLRVHSLARVLGTTSRRIIDALVELDGRTRSAHSTVGREEADRVRDALAESEPAAAAEPPPAPAAAAEPPPAPAAAAESPPAPEPAAESTPETVAESTPETVAESTPETVSELVAEEEPESRLILETPATQTAEPADYLPLFVAPKPVLFEDDKDTDTDEDDDTEDDDTEDDDGADSDDDEQAERPAAKRRRRGRRGRGRGRGEQNGDDPGADTDGDGQSDGDQSDSDDDADDDSDSGDDDGSGPDGGKTRRRRRRRRKSGSSDDNEGGTSPDDPPNTVVHERPPRRAKGGGNGDSPNNEIQGISGSTRLEAKRQRRRDGRDAGRRRPPILSEAEFLARREAVERMMIIRDKVRTEPPHEGARYTQIAVLEDGVVVEHFVTSAASASLVGNIYLGIVQNVLPSMEAAFVDIGRGRNGVLYAGEVNWEAAGLGGAQRKIEQALKPGDYVVVQVTKDPVGHKGARLTTQVSLAGRYLVYVPGASSTGISRKLPDTERQRLKEILREVVPSDAGVIIRTASEGVKEDDIRTDVERLQERWNGDRRHGVRDHRQEGRGAAVALYEEPDVLVKVIRDLFNEDFNGLIVSGDDAWTTIDDYVNSVAPELLPRMTKYEPAGADAPDVFAVHRIDEQLTKAMDRKVYLPSGGTLVIDRTEAMTVVDVNTGKFTGSGGNLEQTVTRNNLEAAEETVRQLRLRDIGGIVVIDFIDMVLESNRDLVLRRLTEALGRDRTRHQVSEVTSLGLVQLTRKRLGTGLIEAFSTTCHALRRAAASCSTATPSTPRRLPAAGPNPTAVPAPAPDAAASAESAAGRDLQERKCRSSRCPHTCRVSIRCSRRWPRPTASSRTTTSDDDDDTTRRRDADEVVELDPDTIRDAVIGNRRGPRRRGHSTTDDKDEDDEESTRSTSTTTRTTTTRTTTTTTRTTRTTRTTIDDLDDSDDDSTRTTTSSRSPLLLRQVGTADVQPRDPQVRRWRLSGLTLYPLVT